MSFKSTLVKIRDAVFPLYITCELCGKDTFDNSPLCPKCRETVQFITTTCCPVCGRKTARPEICGDCKAMAPLYKKGVSAFVYDGGGTRLVIGFKNGKPYLAEYFATLILEKIQKFPAFDFVTFVPITKKKQRARGYNQGELLAKKVAEKLDIPALCVLEKKRETNDQKGLTRRERSENLKAVFKITDRRACKDRTILLVDDVLTTGATADEVCRELKIAGAKAVYFAAVSSVEFKMFREEEEL